MKIVKPNRHERESHFRPTVRKRPRKSKRGDYYLYAISDGDFVKLGMSRDCLKRLEALQVGHPKELVLVKAWHVARYPHLAKQSERKMHKRFKKFLVRGEWFSVDVVEHLDSYQPKSYLHVDFAK